MLSTNREILNESEIKILEKIEDIFNDYLYTPRHKPYDITELFNDLNELGYYIHKSINRKKKTFSSPLASGIKKNKTRKVKKTRIFKRKPLMKRFKNPFLLSLK
jgi:hypothetical protein